MTNYQTELLDLIKLEFKDYSAISLTDHQRRHDKKQFINGLMTAARAIGISFEQLNAVVESFQLTLCDCDDLSVPAYIRELARTTSSVRS
ncbi:hypothetical protein VII00023_22984 [Vibrio ichthyoenteri ATCC 700023]|uniref:Uncharacterized protein n=1 Tax=Vibrio ichthyoenteri ATCC 700023 TaxID=870968 RepID=F9S7K2_9VIBR|nr:hypothetical protein [Vibrio ichthyoenteri]EGU31298.1 hypothetical protein VII00023_22984 [Vibrio ichthyoenteri ATCC 700023]